MSSQPSSGRFLAYWAGIAVALIVVHLVISSESLNAFGVILLVLGAAPLTWLVLRRSDTGAGP